MFTIRTYIEPLIGVISDSSKAAAIASAIRSMNEASLRYKGMLDRRRRAPRVPRWLTSHEPKACEGEVVAAVSVDAPALRQRRPRAAPKVKLVALMVRVTGKPLGRTGPGLQRPFRQRVMRALLT